MPGSTPCPEAVLQFQAEHKTLSQMKNDLLVLTGAGTRGWKQPWQIYSLTEINFYPLM
jgi:hypothetical protein